MLSESLGINSFIDLRRANIKFNQDELGMFKNKYITRWDDLLFRMARTEGVVTIFVNYSSEVQPCFSLLGPLQPLAISRKLTQILYMRNQKSLKNEGKKKKMIGMPNKFYSTIKWVRQPGQPDQWMNSWHSLIQMRPLKGTSTIWCLDLISMLINWRVWIHTQLKMMKEYLIFSKS